MPIPSRAAAIRKQEIEVTEIPVPRDTTSIPPEVVEYFLGKGLRVSWGARYDTVVTKASIDFRYPVNIETDIDKPEVREAIRKSLREYGSRIADDGSILRGDCLLYCQSEEAWQAADSAAWEKFHIHNSNAEREAFIERMNEQIARENPGAGRVRIDDSVRGF
jgi:hypothetical protein